MKKITYIPNYSKNYSEMISLLNPTFDLVIFSFVEMFNDGFVGLNDVKTYIKLKEALISNNIDVGISVGGSNSNFYFNNVDNTIKYLKLLKTELNLTHINFDWEFPTNSELNDYFSLINLVKTELNIEVSVCVTSDCDWGDSYLNQVDYVFVMGYDFYNVPNKEQHHSPIDIGDYIDNNFTIDKSKLVGEIPLYGKSDVDYIVWKDMIEKDSNKYLTTNQDNEYSWNNINDTISKISLMNNKNFGGCFFWHLGMDSTTNPIINSTII